MGFLQTFSYGTRGGRPCIKKACIYRPFYFFCLFLAIQEVQISDYQNPPNLPFTYIFCSQDRHYICRLNSSISYKSANKNVRGSRLAGSLRYNSIGTCVLMLLCDPALRSSLRRAKKRVASTLRSRATAEDGSLRSTSALLLERLKCQRSVVLWSYPHCRML